ncbi:MAG: hypothetical protein Q4A69_07730 [Moraxella sp.]|nr:hypothetical protein [Moraxella sp.]
MVALPLPIMVMWKLKYNDTTTPPVTPTTPVVITKIDTANTLQTINKIGQDSFTLMSMQSHVFDHLQYSCGNYQGVFLVYNKTSTSAKISQTTKLKTPPLGLMLVMALVMACRLVFCLLTQSIANCLTAIVIMITMFLAMVIRYQLPTGYFAEVSGAYDKYSATITRPTLQHRTWCK